jgi:drug/metabolite transporter (DMT)-like permease
MNWLVLAIFAYLILALVNLADKFLLDKIVPSAKTYTFLVSILGLMVLVAAPWALHWPGFYWLVINLIVGAIFPFALLLLYRALKLGDTSKIIPLIGGAIPIFTIALSILFLGDIFSLRQWLAIVLLICGTVLMALMPAGHSLWSHMALWFGFTKAKNRKAIMTAIGAGLLFALFFVGTKYTYQTQEFLSAFIWVRIGTFLAGLSLLLPIEQRKEIIHGLKKIHGGKGFLLFANQAIAAIGFLLQNYAIFLGSVALVNALQGVQYAFLLVLGALISVFYPGLLKENISAKVIIQKFSAVILISIGLYFLAF